MRVGGWGKPRRNASRSWTGPVGSWTRPASPTTSTGAEIPAEPVVIMKDPWTVTGPCYLSRFMVLHPGDVINTGTPAGVALGRPEPRPYLRHGDVVQCGIDGLGTMRQTFRQA